jgi:ubiquinone/menaquinone biosynthesis C-methylase UbiE
MSQYISPKIKALLEVINESVHFAKVYMDIGCSDGELTYLIAKAVKANKIIGIDIDAEALKRAKAKGIDTYLLDVDKDALPCTDDSVDFITALDIIEHLINPDNLLREARRCLKKGGYFLITTPNMASWYNRILLLFGYPILGIDLSNELRYRYPLGVTSVISGHRRLYTLKALEELLKFHGFRIIRSRGYAQIWSKTEPHGFLKLVYHLDKLLEKRATLAANLLILAMKIE